MVVDLGTMIFIFDMFGCIGSLYTIYTDNTVLIDSAQLIIYTYIIIYAYV